MNSLLIALAGLTAWVDKPPSEDEIGTGWWYLLLFVGLAGAVTFLGFSLNKQLRKTRSNAEHGVFGDNGHNAH